MNTFFSQDWEPVLEHVRLRLELTVTNKDPIITDSKIGKKITHEITFFAYKNTNAREKPSANSLMEYYSIDGH